MTLQVILDEREWQTILGIISTAPWRDANPLLMKIGEQLNRQQQPPAPPPQDVAPRREGNGKEADHA